MRPDFNLKVEEGDVITVLEFSETKNTKKHEDILDDKKSLVNPGRLLIFVAN